MPGTPLTYKGQNIFNLSLLAVTVVCFVCLLVFPGASAFFYLMLILAFAFGVLLLLPIWAASMLVVFYFLNSHVGLAVAASGIIIVITCLITVVTLHLGFGF